MRKVGILLAVMGCGGVVSDLPDSSPGNDAGPDATIIDTGVDVLLDTFPLLP